MAPRPVQRLARTSALLLVVPAVLGLQVAETVPDHEAPKAARGHERPRGAGSFRREPVFGPTLEGEAFYDYAQAIERAAELGPCDATLSMTLRLRPTEVPEVECEAFARRWAPALASLSAGAHRESACPAVRVHDTDEDPTMRLRATRDLVNAATIEVRRRLARGERRAAVELSLEAATFATDLVRIPRPWETSLASALLAIAAPECWRDEDLSKLDADALNVLADGLARIDERWPLTVDWRSEGSARPAFLDEALASEGLEPGTRVQVDAERSLRTAAATVRLLRLAVAFHAGEPAPALTDPISGGPLRCVSRADGSLELLSDLGRGTVGARIVSPARQR